MMDKIDENDILVYADAGCVINKENPSEFNEHIKLAKEYGSVSFQMNQFKESDWNKGDLINHLDAWDHIHTGQIHATVFF